MIVYSSLNNINKFLSSNLKFEGHNFCCISFGRLLFFNFWYNASLIKFLVKSSTSFCSKGDINEDLLSFKLLFIDIKKYYSNFN